MVNSSCLREGGVIFTTLGCFLLPALRNCQALKIPSMCQTRTGHSWFCNADVLILELTSTPHSFCQVAEKFFSFYFEDGEL